MYSNSNSLTEKENKQANGAKQRALNILNDALKKKDHLLVDNPEEFGDQRKSKPSPLISTDLVKELISHLQKVVFKRGELQENTIAYVCPMTETEIIYLCPPFWKQHKFHGTESQPMTIIHEVSHLLGYGHIVEENEEKLKTSQQYKLCPVSVLDIEHAFSKSMKHSGTYTKRSYSCCGETSQDTVCEKSAMSDKLRWISALTTNITTLSNSTLAAT
ncbi:uncharacterized protein [Aquarana catesbeiana]|uniref:uncharacterized protein n=1 Tax=Aquarana catesbeiana TaxID=8400 RepID=UPI003CC99DCF